MTKRANFTQRAAREIARQTSLQYRQPVPAGTPPRSWEQSFQGGGYFVSFQEDVPPFEVVNIDGTAYAKPHKGKALVLAKSNVEEAPPGSGVFHDVFVATEQVIEVWNASLWYIYSGAEFRAIQDQYGTYWAVYPVKGYDYALVAIATSQIPAKREDGSGNMIAGEADVEVAKLSYKELDPTGSPGVFSWVWERTGQIIHIFNWMFQPSRDPTHLPKGELWVVIEAMYGGDPTYPQYVFTGEEYGAGTENRVAVTYEKIPKREGDKPGKATVKMCKYNEVDDKWVETGEEVEILSWVNSDSKDPTTLTPDYKLYIYIEQALDDNGVLRWHWTGEDCDPEPSDPPYEILESGTAIPETTTPIFYITDPP